MVESIGHGISLCLLLQVVVAYPRSHIDALFDIAILERAEHLMVMISPDAGQEVGLQLQADTDAVALLLAHSAHLLVGLVQDSEQVLHVVAHLVRNDVGIGKVAIGSQLPLHLGKEGKVDIHTLVGRAIEWTRRSCGSTAPRLYTARKEHQAGRFIGAPHLLELLCPHIFGTGQYLAREFGQCLFLCRRFIGRCLSLFGEYTAQICIFQYTERIATHHPCQQGCNDQTTDADSGLLSSAHTAAVVHMTTLSSSV